jgi:glyoxylase-like metal-dependent hydrolase (beta-lactamase superfamily II)
MPGHTWGQQAVRFDDGEGFVCFPGDVLPTVHHAPPDENNRIGLQTNCLLLKNGRHTVLVETGYGDKWTDKQRGHWDPESRTVVDALREVDCPPEAVDLVVVTHLHFDHAAALTRMDESGEAIPTFPNAEVVTQRLEWDDALANKSTMHRTYLRNHLDPIADRVADAGAHLGAAGGSLRRRRRVRLLSGRRSAHRAPRAARVQHGLRHAAL